MKINTTKLVVGVLAVAGVASLVGSISGTVAWFQYNTRTVAEFGGTTTKCSEYLEMRTVSDATGIEAASKVANAEALPTLVPETHPAGTKIITDGGKVFTSNGESWGEGADIEKGTNYKVGDKVYKLGDSGWTDVTDTKVYGEWINYLDKNAMKELTGNAGNYKPVTAPGAKSEEALPTLKANPICGYTDYDKWNDADADDYMQFTLQFRVLDLDGSTTEDDNDREMLATKLYITDLTLQDTSDTEGGKKDITSALRFHIADHANDENNLLLGWGKDAEHGGEDTFITNTHGELNLGGVDRVANDIGLDVRNNYSFQGENLYKPLNYGVIPADTENETAEVTDSAQTVLNLNYENVYIPDDDGKGNLSNGKAIGTTVAHTMGDEDGALEDDEYLTFTFTTWLEGWHEFEKLDGEVVPVNYIGIKPATANNAEKWFDYKNGKLYSYNATATGEKWVEESEEPVNTAKIYSTDNGETGMQYVDGAWKNVNNRIWSDVDYVGSTFNIGISFGVNALQ